MFRNFCMVTNCNTLDYLSDKIQFVKSKQLTDGKQSEFNC